MSKTIDLQIEKSMTLINALKVNTLKFLRKELKWTTLRI